MLSEIELYEIEIEHLRDYIHELREKQRKLENNFFTNKEITNQAISDLQQRLEILESGHNIQPSHFNSINKGILKNEYDISKIPDIENKSFKQLTRTNQTLNDPKEIVSPNNQKIYSNLNVFSESIMIDMMNDDVSEEYPYEASSNFSIFDQRSQSKPYSSQRPLLPEDLDDPSIHTLAQKQKINSFIEDSSRYDKSNPTHYKTQTHTPPKDKSFFQSNSTNTRSSPDLVTKSPVEKVTYQIHNLNKSIDFERMNKSVAILADQEDETALKAIDETFERQEKKDAAFEIRSIVDRLDKSILHSELTESEFDKFLRLDAISHKIQNFHLPEGFFHSLVPKKS